MSALPSGSGVAARLAPAKPKSRGFLHIVRHGAGPHAIYVVTYHRLGNDGLPALDNHQERKERASVPSASASVSVSSTPHSSAQARASATTAPPKPVLAQGAHARIELLVRTGVGFRLDEARGALQGILRPGSAN